ncbi:MAG: hypothetical protein JWM32_2617 [Verrucomicrobia bacterium]|nr:hypothetical protein [Verrucomicrobiota bacterium]
MKSLAQHLLRCATFAVGATLATYAAHAAQSDTTMADSSKLSHGDRAFFEKAAKSGMKEVAVSQAVTDRLMNAQVKDLAQMMIADHTAANNELSGLAARKGVTLPAGDPKIAEKWGKKDKGVDKDYLGEMVEDHEDAVKLFEKASKSDDADIAAWAQKTLPALQHHLEMAKTLKKAM